MKKFTLIELLVVIAVIGILMTFLLPSLKKAREQSRRAVCLSNNSQIFSGLQLYEKVNNKMPGGNATVSPGLGIDATYVPSLGFHMGLSNLTKDQYIGSAEVLYCPSWTHPYLNYGQIDKSGDDAIGGPNNYGGFPKNSTDPWPTWYVGISYHYRSTLGEMNNEFPVTVKADNPSGLAINADHWSRRYVLYGKEYGHFDAYGTLYLDGHAKIKHDSKAYYMESKNPAESHGNWSFQESVWQDFFDQ